MTLQKNIKFNTQQNSKRTTLLCEIMATLLYVVLLNVLILLEEGPQFEDMTKKK